MSAAGTGWLNQTHSTSCNFWRSSLSIHPGRILDTFSSGHCLSLPITCDVQLHFPLPRGMEDPKGVEQLVISWISRSSSGCSFQVFKKAVSFARVETHRELIETWPRAHGYRFGFHLGDVLSLRTQRDWGKAWQKGNGQRFGFASGMLKMSQRTPQISPAKITQDDQAGEWTTDGTLPEDCGAVLSPSRSQQLAPGRPWNPHRQWPKC